MAVKIVKMLLHHHSDLLAQKEEEEEQGDDDDDDDDGDDGEFEDVADGEEDDGGHHKSPFVDAEDFYASGWPTFSWDICFTLYSSKTRAPVFVDMIDLGIGFADEEDEDEALQDPDVADDPLNAVDLLPFLTGVLRTCTQSAMLWPHVEAALRPHEYKAVAALAQL